MVQVLSRWRPVFHCISNHSWLNDPCAPGYDPTTDTYHLAFQWNPNGAQWADMAWGKSTSTDVVSWKTSTKPCLDRDTPYDKLGVFTGCFRATGINGAADGTLTYLYTAVSKLPIHHSLPYNYGSETLAIATSKDGGNTWTKLESNPILPGPPSEINVTGWRDPYVCTWPSLSKALNGSEEALYGIISGGVVGKGPTSFVYSVDRSDLTQWRFLGPAIDVGLNFSPSRWTGDQGVNWEVTNFMTLANESRSRTQDFLIFGAEDCRARYAQEGSLRPNRGQLWLAADVRPQDGSAPSAPFLEYRYGGVFDHGLCYAANGFYDPKTEQQIVFGWVTEDDLPVDLQIEQNWSGCLSLPRVVSLMTIDNVVRARASELESITSINAESGSNGTKTVSTMRISPDKRLEALRGAAKKEELSQVSLGPVKEGQLQLPLLTSRWELEAEFAVSNHCQNVGIVIHHSKDLDMQTRLYWSPSSEDFIIERPNLTISKRTIQFQKESAPHTLFTVRSAGGEMEEKLRVHAFYDGSVLEVYVNERTVITTRVYTLEERCFGLGFFAEEADGAQGVPATLTKATVWDGLVAE
ncbi:glycoside hydrolase family 32 protein [Aplosporella prunicola CBS 121167]|uniref:Glycoside hydrolase family 32 protein n=1 Tax=Aplosporella prunicola CBS 121167 TaxID=1176127 RepID=A0A6A6AZT8_9PEZI|nr:glycoside hydrolase family 32 protein [Aplosporella prunicola CBS 121167]KAF2135981.1 glycoside hydrolase family 32 protein [Aplosporella prunicola CBS 121167]